jgi:putative ABC transport system ATP-binding protein
MIRGQEITKTYRTAAGEVRALDRVQLELKPAEFVALRGPSGCGKTTLLLILGGMLRPTAGRVWLGEQDLYAASAADRARVRAREIGFVFQMFHLVPYLTVLENVLLTAAPPPASTAREGARQLLEQVGLGHRLGHRPSELSAGERQRTALARALLSRPRFILADEPTGNLDPANAGEVFRHLAAFHRNGGGVLVATHGNDAAAYATRCLEMRAGALVA